MALPLLHISQLNYSRNENALQTFFYRVQFTKEIFFPLIYEYLKKTVKEDI